MRNFLIYCPKIMVYVNSSHMFFKPYQFGESEVVMKLKRSLLIYISSLVYNSLHDRDKYHMNRSGA